MGDAVNPVKAIFLAALEDHTTEQWPAFLEQACAGDTGLRAEVEKLLHARSEMGSFHETSRLGLSRTVDEPLSERPGTVIGPYKLLEQIGEGGFGVVFMAEQQQPVRRTVALKLLKLGMDTRQVVARFEAERQALALMDHLNIARVFDGGETPSGRPYFVMELIHGIPITDFCDRNHLPIRERLELFLSLCQAVRHAHQKGIIHRDLKPSNILVTLHDGTPVVKVIDFGVAKAIEQRLTERTLVTQSGIIVGTFEYMSPEQAETSALGVDTRSDIYSLGVLLYELLTGTTPLERQRLRVASYAEIVRLIREEEPPKPSTRINTLGRAATTVSTQRQSERKQLSRLFRGELDWIAMKALEKDRNRRYETANSFAADVQRYLRDEPVRACPPSAVYRLRKFARRNKAVFLTALAVAASLVLAVVVLAISTVRINAALRQARLREADALVGEAHGTRLSRRPGQRFEALAALRKAADIGRELGQPPAWFDRPRNEAIAALALPDIHITHEFGSFPPGTRWVKLNDDFTWYVRTTDKGGCTIRRVDDDTEVASLPEQGEPAEAVFGSGNILAVRFPNSHRFQLWDLSGAEPILRFEALKIGVFIFRNDGRLVALAHLDGAISVYETASGKRVYQLATERIVQGLDARLHPIAPFVACGSYFHHDVQIRDLHSGKVVATAMTPWPGGSDTCWSPDGRTLLVADSNNSGIIQEYAFDPAAPALRLVRKIQGRDMGGVEITYNPAGDRFVCRGWSSTVHLFDAVSGHLLFSTPALPMPWDNLLRFDRGGQRLAGARVGDRKDRLGLWSVADGREYRALADADNGIIENASQFCPAIHPAGRLLAIGLTDSVALFDLETGRELDRLRINNRPIFVSFDGAGNLLTNGFEGFFRWPVKADAANPCRLTVGPPERLPFHPGDRHIAASRDGQVIAQGMWPGYGMERFAGGWILHPNSPTPRRVEAGQDIDDCCVSPDGRWVVLGVNESPLWKVKIYDAATGQLVWQSPGCVVPHARFTPDGRWLVTGVDGGRVYAAGTWEPGPRLGPGRPWAVTSEWAVFGQTDGTYRLVDLATGRELARLEDPELNNGAATLTPDGTKLIVAAKNGLRVWDLRRIRAELAKLDLDWDAPPYPPAPRGAEATPLAIHVELGDTVQLAQAHSLVRQAEQHIDAKEHAKAVAALRQAVKIAPRCATAHNNLAWLLLTGPMELRDPPQALALARKAVELRPARYTFFHTLGAALYYTGRFAEAIPILERSLREGNGRAIAYALFFLAMCHHRLGDAAKAKDCRERGKEWLRNYKSKLNADGLKDLTDFQAECESVLASPPGQATK